MSSPPAGEASSPKKMELTSNEFWLLSNALMHHKIGIATSDIDWNAVMAAAGCPYGSEASIKVTFNKLRQKLGLVNPNTKASGGAAAPTAGSMAADGTPKKKATPRTPRKKKGDDDAPSSATKKTPNKVVKASRGRKTSAVNKEALATVFAGTNSNIAFEEEMLSSGADNSTPMGENGESEVPYEGEFGEEFVDASMLNPRARMV